MAFPPGMELHGAGWRITKRIPKALLSHYTPDTRLRFQTGEPDKKTAAVLAWRWLTECEEEFQRIRSTGSKYRQDTLSSVISHFLGKQPQDAPMFKKTQGATALLLEVLGDRPISTIKQKEIDDFFGLLCRLPPRWHDKKRQLTRIFHKTGRISLNPLIKLGLRQ